MPITRDHYDHSDEEVAFYTKKAQAAPYTAPQEVFRDWHPSSCSLFCIPSCQTISAAFKPEEAMIAILEYAKGLVGQGLTQLQAEKMILVFAANDVLPRNERARRLDYLDRTVPPEYGKPIIRDRLPDPAAHDLVMRWAENPGERGLFLVGFTGTGKTRSAYAALKKHHMAVGGYILFVTSNEFKAGVVEHSFEAPDTPEGLSSWMSKFWNSPILAFDDITQAKFTPAYAEKLYEVIETRTRNGDPMIITSQLEGQALIARLAGTNRDFIETAQCIERRIRDYCEVVRFSQPKASGRRKV